MGVRSIEKGKAALQDIENTAKRPGVAEVWEIDLSSYASVKAFVAQVAGLPRIDALVANASIATRKFEVFEDNESTITVNVVSTFLLILLVLPTLRKSAEKWSIIPVITFVSSDVHSWVQFPEWKSPNIFDNINGEKTANMPDR
jgi:NAD(P)-dependent dehydrogenase (short-subunit alcohol dehydrogenase family)